MKIMLAMPGRDTKALREALQRVMPNCEVVHEEDPRAADFVIAWKHRPGSLAACTDAKAIYSYGAGVDFLLADTTLPDVPIGRVVLPSLGNQMSRYVLSHVLPAALHADVYQELQSHRLWRPQAPISPATLVLGGGSIGGSVAQSLRQLGLAVTVWKRSNPDGEPDTIIGLDALSKCLPTADFVINTLPLTPETRGLLNHEFFRRMRPTSCLINVGRGEHLVESELVAALNDDELGSAVLDVFHDEPLPSDSPLWAHPKIHITPHIASLTAPHEAARVLADEFTALYAGEQPKYLVDKENQY